jgi:Glycosyltransferase like family 2
MIDLAISIFIGVLILTLLQIAFTIPFANQLRPASLIALPLPAPQVTVVLCLPGADPMLAQCLEGLLNQDYPNYTVQIVVDRRDDPAWDVVAHLRPSQTAIKLQVQVLRNRLDTCSLKCSSLIQAIADLDPTCEIVACLEADTVPHATWLSELVAPLADDRIGATTGYPWYVATGRQPGTVMRYLWNATTVIMMYFNQIPWSGSIAFKTERLQQTQLVTDWHHALTDAVPIWRALRRSKQRIQFVPSLIMVNQSDCTLAEFFSWATRQMVMIRLYHPSWWGTVIVSLINCLVLGRALVMLAIAAWSGHGSAAMWLAAGLASYVAVMVWLVGWLERAVGRIMQARGERRVPVAGGARLLIAIGVLGLQWVQTLTLLAGQLAKTIQWHGTTYQIDGPWQIRVLPDRLAAPLTSRTTVKLPH